MSTLHALCTVLLTVALSGFAVIAIGCIWPTDPPLLSADTRTAPHSTRHPVESVPASMSWTCALPGVPLDLDDAYNALRHHRAHDCPRRRIAYATLIAHGCLVPDAHRPSRRTVVP
ncbi:hypothetical protein [Nocardia carnea]|uniref:Lipoprotein n=1 Tax=Nocardia carnea TaxID=37328 RepID=A0ABW7TVB7_9NOCA|nr:hypothetical protein [Nocardia carnea]